MTLTEALDRIDDPRRALAYLAGFIYSEVKREGRISYTLDRIAASEPDIANLIRSIGALA